MENLKLKERWTFLPHLHISCVSNMKKYLQRRWYFKNAHCSNNGVNQIITALKVGNALFILFFFLCPQPFWMMGCIQRVFHRNVLHWIASIETLNFTFAADTLNCSGASVSAFNFICCLPLQASDGVTRRDESRWDKKRKSLTVRSSRDFDAMSVWGILMCCLSIFSHFSTTEIFHFLKDNDVFLCE